MAKGTVITCAVLIGIFLSIIPLVLRKPSSEYNITTMERPCNNCDLWLKEYKGVSDKQLQYYLSRFKFLKKYDLIDTMVIDTLQ